MVVYLLKSQIKGACRHLRESMPLHTEEDVLELLVVVANGA